MDRRLLVPAAALCCALVVGGCGDSGDGEAPADSSPTPAVQDSPTAPAEGTDEAPPEDEATSDAGEDMAAADDGGGEVPEGLDWVLEDINGGQVVGAELAGRDLVLWFWAPW